MGFWDDLIVGRYLPGNSRVHRFDARWKVAVCLGLVILTFSVAQPLILSGLTVLALLMYALAGVPGRMLWRGWWALRWFLLLSLVLHTLLTPGHTLFGVSWLSLDGLLRGISVDVQVSLALLFASLLTLTTPPAAIAAGCGFFLQPLALFGVPVARGVALVEQVLDFIPLVQAEARDALLRGGELSSSSHRKGLLEQGRQVSQAIGPLILRLADLAEEKACQLAAERQLAKQPPQRNDHDR